MLFSSPSTLGWCCSLAPCCDGGAFPAAVVVWWCRSVLPSLSSSLWVVALFPSLHFVALWLFDVVQHVLLNKIMILGWNSFLKLSSRRRTKAPTRRRRRWTSPPPETRRRWKHRHAKEGQEGSTTWRRKREITTTLFLAWGCFPPPKEPLWSNWKINSKWRCFPPPPFWVLLSFSSLWRSGAVPLSFGSVLPSLSLHLWVVMLLPLQQKTWLCYLHKWNQIITQEGKRERNNRQPNGGGGGKQHHPKEGGEMLHQPEGGWLSRFPPCAWWCVLSFAFWVVVLSRPLRAA